MPSKKKTTKKRTSKKKKSATKLKVATEEVEEVKKTTTTSVDSTQTVQNEENVITKPVKKPSKSKTKAKAKQKKTKATKNLPKSKISTTEQQSGKDSSEPILKEETDKTVIQTSEPILKEEIGKTVIQTSEPESDEDLDSNNQLPALNRSKEEPKHDEQAKVVTHIEIKKPEISPKKQSRADAFYFTEPYIFLVNPDLFPKKITVIREFKTATVLKDFFSLMKADEAVFDFKILGMALLSAAKLHKNKVHLAIAYEKKEESKFQIRRQRTELKFDKPLQSYITRNQLELIGGGNDSEIFFEELLFQLKEEEERRKRLERKRQREAEGKKKTAARRRKLTADDLKPFEYKIDFDRIEIISLIVGVFETIVVLCKKKGREVNFEKVLEERMKKVKVKGELDDRFRLERVRVFMSLMYLIRDTVIEVYQDLDTMEISIKLMSTNVKRLREKMGEKKL